MKTADGRIIEIGSVVYIRVGGEYPRPGNWRVRKMRVKGLDIGRVRLVPDDPRRTTKCWREPASCFQSRELAKGGAT